MTALVMNVAAPMHATPFHSLTHHHYSPASSSRFLLKPTNYIDLLRYYYNNNNKSNNTTTTPKTNNKRRKLTTTLSSISNNNNMNNNNNNNNVSPSPPSWEVLALLSDHLDPKTLATACCVSKSWFTSFSSDHLWDPLCSAHFPTLAALHPDVGVPRRRVYGIGYEAARLRERRPSKPKLSLDDLLFTITIRVPGGSSGGGGHVINMVKPCKELKRDPHGTFRFDVDVEDDQEREWGVDELAGVKVTWNVVDKEWRAVFVMAEECGVKKGGFAACSDGWFSEELPSPGCCTGGLSSGLVADLRLEMAAVAGLEEQGGRSVISSVSKKMKIEKVKLGVMCIINWRYLSLDDALSYLDHFLPL